MAEKPRDSDWPPPLDKEDAIAIAVGLLGCALLFGALYMFYKAIEVVVNFVS